MIPHEIIEEIKYRVDIVDLISSYLPLKRAGSNYNGRCPFHSERTPSFTVFPSTKSFYCFGCGAGGDIITFIMKHENLDYHAALELLASRAGIRLPEEQDDRSSSDAIKKERILAMNREAAKFFHSCLLDPKYGRAGLEYLTGRGLSGAVIKHFGLGFAPDGFGLVTSHLSSLGYTPEEMATGFLCGISKKTGKPYDYFRNRVIFPIIDVAGNVIAFGGRVMDDSVPKYLNTSDTPAFKKSRNLFALNFAKGKCSERLILCEGYMDVIALHANQFENAVATLGTAITPDQARIMSKYTKQVIISYDSDSAGQTATSKAMRLLADAGLDVRILKLNDGSKDPDEFFRKNPDTGREKFKLLLDNSRSGFEFKLESVLSKHNISLTDEKVKAADELCRIIAEAWSESERQVYIGVVSQRLGIPHESLENDVKRLIKKNAREKKAAEMQDIMRKTAGFGDRVNIDAVKNTGAVNTEENILGILLLFPENIEPIKKGKIDLKAEDFFSEFNRRVFTETTDRYREGMSFDFGILAECFTPDEMGRITSMIVRRRQLSDNGSEVLADLIARLKSETLKKRYDESGDAISAINDIIAEKRKKLK